MTKKPFEKQENVQIFANMFKFNFRVIMYIIILAQNMPNYLHFLIAQFWEEKPSFLDPEVL